MRLLASTDIALRILMLLGREKPEQPVNVERLARELGGLSRNHLHKIVQDLAFHGVLRTIRGAGGGVLLAKPLEDVRLGQLVRALEQDQPVVECFRADGGFCSLEPGCALRFMLREARESFYASLDRRTLADCVPTKGPRYAAQPSPH
jgi:Rrf2 family transcriptional regulator, nitric oxide-sensitive transcriptional repressor